MIGSVRVSAGSEQLASAMFAPAQLPDVLEIISWYDDVQADDVHRAVLTLSKGDMKALLDLIAAAMDDFRDVLMWASLPEPTPEERAAARVRVEELVRGHRQARHRYLVSRFGAKGAEQIERRQRESVQELAAATRTCQTHLRTEPAVPLHRQ